MDLNVPTREVGPEQGLDFLSHSLATLDIGLGQAHLSLHVQKQTVQCVYMLLVRPKQSSDY
jgi:hypothetical protein